MLISFNISHTGTVEKMLNLISVQTQYEGCLFFCQVTVHDSQYYLNRSASSLSENNNKEYRLI